MQFCLVGLKKCRRIGQWIWFTRFGGSEFICYMALLLAKTWFAFRVGCVSISMHKIILYPQSRETKMNGHRDIKDRRARYKHTFCLWMANNKWLRGRSTNLWNIRILSKYKPHSRKTGLPFCSRWRLSLICMYNAQSNHFLAPGREIPRGRASHSGTNVIREIRMI